MSAAPSPPDPARYAYLVGRLRDRRITMEEATELFAIQQGMIRAAYQSRTPASALAPPTPPPQGSGRPPVPAPGSKRGGSGPTGLALTDDTLMVSLLALGAGAGLLAALVKRSQTEAVPARTPARKTSKSSS